MKGSVPFGAPSAPRLIFSIRACAAFERPADFIGRRIELAGEERSAEELCEVIARVRGEVARWADTVKKAKIEPQD